MNVDLGIDEWEATAIVVATVVVPEDHDQYPTPDQVQWAVLTLVWRNMVHAGMDDEAICEFIDQCPRFSIEEDADSGTVRIVLPNDVTNQAAVLTTSEANVLRACQLIADGM